jgi:hypothetical protein
MALARLHAGAVRDSTYLECRAASQFSMDVAATSTGWLPLQLHRRHMLAMGAVAAMTVLTYKPGAPGLGVFPVVGMVAAGPDALQPVIPAGSLAPPPCLTGSACADEPLRPSDGGEFVNAKQGYQLRVPEGWALKGKAGADALWEDPQRR